MCLFLATLFLQVSFGALFVLPQTYMETASDCSIAISKLKPEPIVVNSSYQFLYADPKEAKVIVENGKTLLISCPGGKVRIGSTQTDSAITATCISGSNFLFNKKTIVFDLITCSISPVHTARYTGKLCEAGGKEIETGFITRDHTFAREILTCFDAKNLISLYSLYDITRSIGHSESVKDPNFIEDKFYNLDVRVNSLYEFSGQRATINGLLDLPANSSVFIRKEDNYFLSRGHLAAKGDFVYAPQQKATYHYINAAPQWQTFNGGNWKTVEENVRNYAKKSDADLEISTGTYGVTTLPHSKTGKEIPLYLYTGNDGVQAIPVPELYWKVVYNPKTKKGFALLGVNNPYKNIVDPICKNDSSVFTLLDWKPNEANNKEKGFLYACTVDDLRKKVPYLPAF